jgi:hypothetical protein
MLSGKQEDSGGDHEGGKPAAMVDAFVQEKLGRHRVGDESQRC